MGMYEDIIKGGLESGKTYDEINEDLLDAGGGLYLDEDGRVVDPNEGIIWQPPKKKDVQREIDKTRRPDLANGTDTQHFNGHDFKVWYNENGYIYRIKKVK